MPSETTADRRLSTAASKATVSAAGRSGTTRSHAEVRNGNCRKSAGNAAKSRPDGFDGQMEQCHRCGPRRECDDRAGHPGPPSRGEQNQDQRCDGQRHGNRIHHPDRLSKHRHPLQELARRFRNAHAEKVLDLRRRNQQGDAVGESNHHRARHELHRLPKACDSKQEEQHAGHHRDHQQTGQAVFGDDAGDDDDKGASGPANLNPRSSQQRDDEPAEDGRVDTGLRGDPGSNAERHRQRQRDDARR